MLTLSQ